MHSSGGFERLIAFCFLQTYLSDSEFQTVFGVTKEEFYRSEERRVGKECLL